MIIYLLSLEPRPFGGSRAQSHATVQGGLRTILPRRGYFESNIFCQEGCLMRETAWYLYNPVFLIGYF